MSKIDFYKDHLLETSEWLKKTIDPATGGSRAYYSLLSGWSSPYPETTGYIIPTMINAGKFLNKNEYIDLSINMGKWLLSIQLDRGAWQGGVYSKNGSAKPSVFNTGQILKGMTALYKLTGEQKWLDSATKGAEWLQKGVNKNGFWDFNDYRAEKTPSYYSHVAWPMLEVWKLTGDTKIKESAIRILDYILSNRLENGSFKNWGFENSRPAFTHTIAYTIRGLQESGLLLNSWHKYGVSTNKALDKLLKKAEFNNGRLPGAYKPGWKPVNHYSCLTGNLQTAICLILMEEKLNDLRIINAAAKMIDWVCDRKNLIPSRKLKGAITGSWPIYGKYMFLRFPNWASKYFCDSIMKLIKRLEKEKT